MLVRDIMHPNVYCATADMPARDLYIELVANGIAGAPVLDDHDNLVGVVSFTDFAAYFAGNVGSGRSDYYGRSCEEPTEAQAEAIDDTVLVGEIMSPRIHQVYYDSSVVEALDLMIEESIHRVVVTHKGHVIGILTSGDLMREFRAVLVGDDGDDDDEDGDDDEDEDEDEDGEDDDDEDH